jgi:PAS domain S-box-containing protein/putative nucleotidyltransferase with HDIG domain
MNDRPTNRHASRLPELAWKLARDPMFVADCETELVVDANPAVERITGFSRDEMIGKHFSMLHPEAERVPVNESFQSAATGGLGAHAGFHLLHKDGASVPVSIYSSLPFELDGRLLIIGIFRDVSDMEEQKHNLKITNWALQAYADAAMALAHAHSPAGLIQDICEAITRESIFVLAWVGYAEEGPEKPVQIVGAAGPALHYLDDLQISWSEEKAMGRGPTGTAIRNNAVVVIEDSEEEEIYKPWREKARKEGIRSTLNAPFIADGNRRGVLAVYASEPHAFGPVVTKAFADLAAELGYGLNALHRAEELEAERLQREKAQKELTGALSAMIGSISTAFEMRDAYTAGHQGQVAAIAYAIGKEMGWDEDRLQALRMAALVHDIGKISIPAEILTKSTTLNAQEWKLIKEHPEMGYKILKDIPFHWPIGEAVRQHHERLDGSGYPRGLKGNAILPGARILAVADIVDSMASERPYRSALGIEIALTEIEKQAGTLLDAEVVRICLSLFREKGFDLPGWKTAETRAI